MALKDKNIPEGSEKTVSSELKAHIEQHLDNGMLPCPVAFTLAQQLDISTADIGDATDALQIRLSRCQLGLFGYPGKQGWKASGVMAQDTPPALKSAIQDATNADNRITCTVAWELAQQFGISRMQVGYLIDSLGVRIVSCQLGVF